jgi:hypothetical protein
MLPEEEDKKASRAFARAEKYVLQWIDSTY